jgi:hypothetical protein
MAEKPNAVETAIVMNFSFIASFRLEFESLEFRVVEFRVGGGEF